MFERSVKQILNIEWHNLQVNNMSYIGSENNGPVVSVSYKLKIRACSQLKQALEYYSDMAEKWIVKFHFLQVLTWLLGMRFVRLVQLFYFKLSPQVSWNLNCH